MTDQLAPDLLMFVGRSYYDEESFIKEVREMGASKRVRQFPFECGKNSQIWFAMHGVPLLMAEDFPSATGIVFCRAKVESFQQIVSDEDIDLVLEDVGSRVKIEVLSHDEVADEPERGCGFRRPGRYLISGHEAEILLPMPISVPHFRGYRYINGAMMQEELNKWMKNTISFSPLNIFAICDEDQLSKQEELELHFIRKFLSQ